LRTTGLRDNTRNENILEELKDDPVENKLAQYKQKLLNHVSRMEDITYTKQLDYRPIGRGGGGEEEEDL
jgi:hypothetical protein